MLVHNITLQDYIMMVKEQKRILKRPFIGTNKRQKVDTKWHNLIWGYVMVEGLGPRSIRSKYSNYIKWPPRKNMARLKTTLPMNMKKVKEQGRISKRFSI